MPAIATIKKELEFYHNFSKLIDVLKSIAIAQYYALEKKIQTYEEYISTVEGFFSMLDLNTIVHPFVRPDEKKPLGIVAITSDRGLLGGLNNRVMNAAVSYMENSHNQLIIFGQQGQKLVHGLNIFFKGFTVGEDEERRMKALQLRDYIIEEVLSGRIGPVKLLYPFPESMQVQKIMEVDILPCTKWPEKDKTKWSGDGEDILFESYPADLAEYLIHLLLGQKIFEILQFARLSEFAARTVHLENSIEKIKETLVKIQQQYFRARHEIIDQQMRELFASRLLYAE